jgi:2-polyprenyl-6-methoxyphenol hydroxylase-like FAD-dependent oxidoreductase
MSQPTVVICGAGIAGPALAFWLNKSGYRVTIVELAGGIRPADKPWICAVPVLMWSSAWA